MQVFKTFFKVLLQQRKTMVIYLIVFLVLEVMMSSMGAEDAKSTYTQKSYNITVFDEDNSPASDSLISHLGTDNKLVEIEDNQELLLDELYARDIVAYIRIPSGFSDAVLSGKGAGTVEITSIPGTMYETIISSQVNQYVSTLDTYLKSGFATEDAIEKTVSTMDVSPSISLHGNYANGQKSRIYYYFAYIPYLLICVSLVGIGSCLLVFNRKSLSERTDCSAMPLLKKNLGLLSASVVSEFVITCIFLLLGVIMFRSELFANHGGLFILNVFCFSSFALSITYLIGLFAKDFNVLNMLGNIIGLSLSFLGGIFVSLDLFSDTMVTVAHFFPTYWFVTACDIIEKASFTTENCHTLAFCYTIQLVFAAALVALTLVISKIRNQEQ